MKSLYRKYRPLKLADVVGQPQVTEPLARAIKDQKFAHAYLFTGPRGCGKTSVARIFAHAVNDFPYTTEDSYVDIIEIDAASNTSVEDIRDLTERVGIAPSQGKYKVYIIDEVHMLSRHAFNALLKTLEEPPEHVIFILATTDAYKVPITITSRAQVFTFKLAESAVMQKHLRKIADAENIKISDDALALIVEQGGGSFRDSLSLLDQIMTLGDEQEITLERLVQILGLPEQKQLENLLAAYTTGDLAKVREILLTLLQTGIKPETVAERLITRIIANPTPESLSLLAHLPSVAAPFAEAKLLVACAPEIIRPTCTAPAASSATPAAMPVTPTPTPAPAVDVATPAHKPEPTPTAAPVPAEAPAVAAASAPAPQQIAQAVQFNWPQFVESFHRDYQAIYNQLQKVNYLATGGVLHLFPKKPMVHSILSRDNNLRVINSFLTSQNLTAEVHSIDDDPVSLLGQPAADAASADYTAAAAAPESSAPVAAAEVAPSSAPATTPAQPTASPDTAAQPSSSTFADKLSEISAIMGRVEEVKDDGDPFAKTDA